ANPMSAWCTVTTMPCAENGVICGGGTRGATITVTASASNIRTRAGTNRAPKIGAIMKHAPMRTNGQKYWASHPSIWPNDSASERAIAEAPRLTYRGQALLAAWLWRHDVTGMRHAMGPRMLPISPRV